MSKVSITELSQDLRSAIAGLEATEGLEQVGIVVRVGDGVAWVHGLRSAGYSEVLEIESEDGIVEAFVLNLNEDEIGAVLLGDDSRVKAGARVTLKGKVLEVPVGEELLGRVVDPLGRPLDGGPEIKTKHFGAVERPAIGVMGRKSVHEPLMTGIISIDAMFPIGRGQRELIIGDRQTGKTAITIDTMINQARQNTGVVNVYVAIGQKLSKIARLVDRLKEEGVMDQTIIVATGPSDPASLLYLAPYAGTAMGEYFRDNSKHALMIYDDLTKHAVAYRQMSLLLRRPPGREAFPGDVFYLHSRLLERSAKLSDELGLVHSRHCLSLRHRQEIFLHISQQMLFRSPMVRFSSRLICSIRVFDQQFRQVCLYHVLVELLRQRRSSQLAETSSLDSASSENSQALRNLAQILMTQRSLRSTVVDA